MTGGRATGRVGTCCLGGDNGGWAGGCGGNDSVTG